MIKPLYTFCVYIDKHYTIDNNSKNERLRYLYQRSNYESMEELIGMKFFITLALLNVFQKCFYREISLPDFNLNVKSFIEHVSFLIDKIKKKLDNLNPYKSPRADELRPRILKELSNELSLPLSLVMSKLFSEENCLKTGRMLLLFHCIKEEKKSLPATVDQLV